MNRLDLIKEIFQKTNFQNYLEIGTLSGNTLLRINAKYKTAVDPVFNIPFEKKVKWLFKEPKNFNNKYFEEESDTFFAKRQDYINKIGQFDVVLVDGLHTFRASLTDVLNSLQYLNSNGLIIMHDCFPPDEIAALPTKTYPTDAEKKSAGVWHDAWCGDVWKAPAYLREALPDVLDVCVIDTDFGLGIIRIKNKIDYSKLTINEELFARIDKLTYHDLKEDPKATINLKPVDYLANIIEEVVSGNKTNE